MRPMRRALLFFLMVTATWPARAQDSLSSARGRPQYGRLQLRGFADVGARVSGEKGRRGGFDVGQFDLYLTSQLSEKLSFLAETVFEYDNDYVVDVERVIVTYAASRAFRVSLGKHHTPIGYWNTRYHHGSLIQPTAERPLLFAFEDEGGVLPIHAVGVLASGRDLSRLHVGYDVLLGNGYGTPPTGDDDSHKAATVAVFSQLNSALRLGASYHADRIPEGSFTQARDTLGKQVSLSFAGGYLAYEGAALEFVGELQALSSRAVGADPARSWGSTVYAGYRRGVVVPYLRVDRIHADPADAYLDGGTMTQRLLGARVDLGASGVLKAELSRSDTRGRPVRQLSIQLAVGF